MRGSLRALSVVVAPVVAWAGLGLADASCTDVLGNFTLSCATPCAQATDCPDPMSPCAQSTCTAGCCGVSDLPATAMLTQTAGTCRREVCDGAGNAESQVDDTNTPAPVDDCHTGGCVAGAPAQAVKAAGSPCTANGGHVCGALTGTVAGKCVACNVTADCKSSSLVCVDNDCVAMSCTDGVKDGSETDKDCGGSCPPCANDLKCAVAADCVSKVCTGGVCQVPTCSDGVQNGNETDVDCGGSCASVASGSHVCAYGKKCAAPGDCASTFCDADLCGAQVLASGVEPHGIAVDASSVATLHSVYWTDGTGAVLRVLANGTSATPVSVAASAGTPAGIVVASTATNGSYVVWSEDLTPGAVHQLPIGSATAGVAALASALTLPAAVATDNVNAYWLTSTGLMAAPVGPTATGTASATPAVTGLASPSGLAVRSPGDLYWTSAVASTGSVNHVAQGGTTSTVLVSGQNNPTAIAADKLNVYWCNNVASGSVMQIAVSPAVGTAVTLATSQNRPISVAVDATFVYWATTGDGRVQKIPIGGGMPATTLVTSEASIDAIALDGSYVYWTNPFAGTVKRVHK